MASRYCAISTSLRLRCLARPATTGCVGWPVGETSDAVLAGRYRTRTGQAAVQTDQHVSASSPFWDAGQCPWHAVSVERSFPSTLASVRAAQIQCRPCGALACCSNWASDSEAATGGKRVGKRDQRGMALLLFASITSPLKAQLPSSGLLHGSVFTHRADKAGNGPHYMESQMRTVFHDALSLQIKEKFNQPERSAAILLDSLSRNSRSDHYNRVLSC